MGCVIIYIIFSSKMEFFHGVDFWTIVVEFLCFPEFWDESEDGPDSSIFAQLRLVSKDIKQALESEPLARFHHLVIRDHKNLEKMRSIFPHAVIKISNAHPKLVAQRPNNTFFEYSPCNLREHSFDIDHPTHQYLENCDEITMTWLPSDPPPLNNCRILRAHAYVDDISHLSHSALHTLVLYNYPSPDISCLGTLKNLKYARFNNCSGITEASMLGHVPTLRFSYCRDFRDVRGLEKVKSLMLRHTAVIDVSRLGAVSELDLSYTNVVDVSALGRVRDLKLEGCTKITDVSALATVRNLNLASCTGITDFSSLGKVHCLNLKRTLISDVRALRNVHSLDLSHTKITDVSMLGGNKQLFLRGTEVEDVTPLATSEVLILSLENTKVKDVSMLKGVYLLYLSEPVFGTEQLTHTQIMMQKR